jgi:hypothetical protein
MFIVWRSGFLLKPPVLDTECAVSLRITLARRSPTPRPRRRNGVAAGSRPSPSKLRPCWRA